VRCYSYTKDVLRIEQLSVNLAHRAQRPMRLPVVLSRREVRAVLHCMTGAARLISGLLYGAGLRLMEGLTLRVKDLDFGRNEIVVRDGKGQRDRVTVLPEAVKEPLKEHLQRVKTLHERDLSQGRAELRYRTLLLASTRMRIGNGRGNG
jgi:integrase